ncbi:hypothetical protein [Curtobacterium sp. ISL-83]|uniref:hypothetical protein n=1 Tax=Curtobacterium sp. ISL-83 TaxID=2819145 RepID=UPI001BE67B51|nr:hypothetical protein [Curtobacterium sp. ISL-83]MBT2501859.1 hypothetical protein [Curtobacterium sp. ISL-83]
MTTTGVTMNTTTGTAATDARAGLVSFVGTAPDARKQGARRRTAPVAPYLFTGTPAVAAPLSA